MKAPNNDIYYKAITYENVISTWDIVRRTCKNKRAIFRYHVNKNSMNYNIYQILLNGLYKPLPFRLFLIFEPKARLVMSQTVGDKIVNHFVANYYLLPYLEKKLIDSNVATRKGKGSRYADKLINSVDLISNDETTVYINIPVETEVGKYYVINQKVRIGNKPIPVQLQYNNQDINYNNEPVMVYVVEEE